VGAAAHRAEVYIDGEKLSEHRCGYTAFRTELTGRLTPGSSARLVIRVDSRESLDQPPFGYVIDYMTYGGLYREVWLEISEETFLADVYVRPAVPGSALLRGGETAEEIASVRFEGVLHSRVTVEGKGAEALRERVYAGETLLTEAVTPLTGAETETALRVPGAALWDVESPALYTLVTELLRGDAVLDRRETLFGFRSAIWRAEGFYLNGRKLKLLGLNRHQSWPYVGYAMPESMQRLDADILKRELGLNAVRTSHYPQSPHFIDRCDELGLLVFTEIPGWQHIGGEDWKKQAVKNTEDMVRQYRNHPSIILWGVRINESGDDDALYTQTNAVAHALDDRATGGVRCIKRSHLLEDVYTYNDFVHDGVAPGCEPKKNITSDMAKPYLISEYGGHMYPTKTYDSEEHRLEHALRHARVLDAAAGEGDIAGTFGWCMADYNTHLDFGSGDRVCYHGVLDMFRNKKLAAEVYSVQQDAEPVLTVSSSMDIGEHPAGNRGRVFLFTNADEVRMYKNGAFIRTYTHADSPFRHLRRGPIEIDDFVGDLVAENEPFAPAQAQGVKDLINYSARYGSARLPAEMMAKAGWLMLRYHMSFEDAYQLYGKYIGNWGQAGSTVYRFEAVKDGAVTAVIERAPVTAYRLHAEVSHTALREGATYDAAALRLSIRDGGGAVLPFWMGCVRIETEGPLAVIGPKTAVLRGGLGGTYVRTLGKGGPAAVTLTADGAESVRIEFNITIEKKEEV